MKKISKLDAALKIFNSKGKTFTVEFVKKDWTIRKMNCRLGVHKHLKGGKLAYNPLDKGMINVFDMQKKEYRMINFNTLKTLTIDKNKYKVE